MFFFIIAAICIFAIYKLIGYYYFTSEEFLAIKYKVASYVNECNELNNHINQLKKIDLGGRMLDYSASVMQDHSLWRYNRPYLKDRVPSPNVYDCSRSVCDAADRNQNKYLSKYFNFPPTEETLEKVEQALNQFHAAKDGRVYLKDKYDEVIKNAYDGIPLIIRLLYKRQIPWRIGLVPVNLEEIKYPSYTFRYISAGGKASAHVTITLDIPRMNDFIQYLSSVIKFRKSVQGQRALMTSALRQKILARDNYTCQECGLSTKQEPHLLLEVDHINPIANGGLTTEDNLQTLCWKCNRSKGSKLIGLQKIATSQEKSEIRKIEIVEQNNNTTRENTINKVPQGISSKNTVDRMVTDIKPICKPQPTSHYRYDKDLTTQMVDEYSGNGYVSVPNHIHNDTKIENKIEPKVSNEINNTKKEVTNMFDIEKGIYPSGRYAVGTDLPFGKYILTKISGTPDAYIQMYKTKKDMLNEDNSLIYDNFKEDYFISFDEPCFIYVENANIQMLK